MRAHRTRAIVPRAGPMPILLLQHSFLRIARAIIQLRERTDA
jgi:hypothetical protein